MNIDALWRVASGTEDELIFTGLLQMDSGRLCGGDSSYYYRGEYAVSGDQVVGRADVTKHSPGISAFGDHGHFEIKFAVEISDGDVLHGIIKSDVTDEPVNICLTKLEELRT